MLIITVPLMLAKIGSAISTTIQSSTPRMKVEPEIYTATGLNEVFGINVTMVNLHASDKAIGFEFKLKYNITLLRVVDVVEGPFLSQFNNNPTGPATYFIYFVEDDYIIVGIYLLPNATGQHTVFPEGNGTLATISFQTIYRPSSVINLSCVLMLYDTKIIDPDDNFILHETESGFFVFNPYPILKVEPEILMAEYRNQTINVGVMVNNLDADWELIGVQFKLHYAVSLLRVVDVVEGPFLSQFNNNPTGPATYFIYFVEDDYIIVGIYLLPNATGQHTVFPEGNGTLATISFQVLDGPPASCNLILDWTTMIDPSDPPFEIPHIVESGIYSFTVERLLHEIVWEEYIFTVVTECNAQVNPVPLSFVQEHRCLSFNVTGPEGMNVYCNVTIPTRLLDSPSYSWLVLVGGYPIQYIETRNDTHVSLYFTFHLSRKPVYIFGTSVIPEFPANITMIASVLTALTIAYLWKARRRNYFNTF
jgi:hypothetical protein